MRYIKKYLIINNLSFYSVCFIKNGVSIAADSEKNRFQ